MSIPLTNYNVNGTNLFSGINGPGAPTGATGYNVDGTNLFSYYTSQGSKYQSNLSNFNYIYKGTTYDIMLYNYFTKATIGTPANATFDKIKNRLCWKITGNTTILFNFPNITTINLVAVGGGQRGPSGPDDGYGGYGGGVVEGRFKTLSGSGITLTITIGGSETNTTITCGSPSISVTANAGSSSGTGGSSSGITNQVYSLGGLGGTPGYLDPYKNGGNGGNGPFINNLGLYVAGGGGGAGAFLVSTFGYGGIGGSAGGGNGFGDLGAGTDGTPNTGGGGGGGDDYYFGGSGVVYLYL
jgi:hypothetical protein